MWFIAISMFWICHRSKRGEWRQTAPNIGIIDLNKENRGLFWTLVDAKKINRSQIFASKLLQWRLDFIFVSVSLAAYRGYKARPYFCINRTVFKNAVWFDNSHTKNAWYSTLKKMPFFIWACENAQISVSAFVTAFIRWFFSNLYRFWLSLMVEKIKSSAMFYGQNSRRKCNY